MAARILAVFAMVFWLSAAAPSARRAVAAAKAPHQTSPQPQNKVEDVTIRGTIQAAARGELRVLAEKNQQSWIVAAVPRTKVVVTGKAEASFLKAGQSVEFYAELDDEDVAKDKVTELTVTAPQAEDKCGVFPPAPAAP